MPFTDRQIQALRAKSERYEKAEPGRTGLRIRVNTDGSKSWTFIYRVDGKQKRMLLGHYEKSGLKPDQTMSLAQAHIALAEAKEKLRAGIDPGAEIAEAREAERNAETFAEMVDDYIRRHVEPNLRPKTAKEEKRILHRDVLPHLGHMKAKDIARRDLVRVLDRIEERGAFVQRNQTAAVFSRLFKFGVRRGIIDQTPALYLRETRFNSQGRERFLSMQEIHDLWHNLDGVSMGHPTRLAIRFALATGQRRTEAAEAARDEIDDDAGLWTLPAERSKNKRPNVIPLPPFIMARVNEADEHRKQAGGAIASSPWLFVSTRKSGVNISGGTLTREFSRYRAELGIGDSTIHDLRRSFATWHGEIGTPPEIISALLNHTPQHITGRIYNRAVRLEQRRAAMERWCDWLQFVIAGNFEAAKVMQGADVVSMEQVVA